MLTLYGIANCDSVKKARQWLDAHQLAYQFVDVRQQPPSTEQWQSWAQTLGTALINKRSTSWRALSREDQADLSLDNMVRMLDKSPTLMKRPLILGGPQPLLGFHADTYSDQLL